MEGAFLGRNIVLKKFLQAVATINDRTLTRRQWEVGFGSAENVFIR